MRKIEGSGMYEIYCKVNQMYYKFDDSDSALQIERDNMALERLHHKKKWDDDDRKVASRLENKYNIILNWK